MTPPLSNGLHHRLDAGEGGGGENAVPEAKHVAGSATDISQHIDRPGPNSIRIGKQESRVEISLEREALAY
jgi:hypothetical protein